MARKQLFTAVKNEAPFIVEWIAYHRAIGFEEFYICSNDSDDGTTELLDALDQAGEIRHFLNKIVPGQSPQLVAAERFRNEGLPVADSGDWVLWLDADEFLNIHVESGHLDDLIFYLGDNTGMLVPWRIFGDGGNDGLPKRFISEEFSRAAGSYFPEQTGRFPEQAQVKTLFRMDDCVIGFGEKSLHRPVVRGGRRDDILQRFRNGDGDPLDAGFKPHRFWAAGGDTGRSCRIRLSEAEGNAAQINHYLVRTPALYKMKAKRGRGYANLKKSGSNDRHTSQFYAFMNRNECEDRSILRFEDATSKEMARIFQIDAVRLAHEDGLRRTRSALGLIDQKESDRLVEPKVAAEASGNAHSDFPLTLPDEEAEFVKSVLGEDRVVLEYGSGGSTFEALRRGAKMVYSTESDASWAKKITETLAGEFSRDRYEIVYADIGRTKAWGKPVSGEAYARYHLYANAAWDLSGFLHPDIVLIDGRFRASCFATTALRIDRQVTVLFDDYKDRTYYHWVEEICPPQKMVGRMAVFQLEPKPLPSTALTRVAGSYVDSR
ncbi:glycosyltransferase family 2 protein [Paracoccus sp. SCSIO 75233]|uniref:glycosyltransferase family 2 protein n=1 Tax=Paracoccus sp. SCSIO 75233 TaxID=3017782 RepID=UPI0022F05E76|nr:glycosyltransferase family 2 protein [Paracoccus sp. SCSIO 75233]WBU54122.1 glycosyltransferase family 2 protein [Paracoccus sp. SCSIO 75233]